MNKKELKIKLTSYLASIALCAIALGGPTLYLNYESVKQVHTSDIDHTNVFKGEDGNYQCYFDIGEHLITVSRNDAYYYKTEEIEGYAIKEVEINGWRDNNKITYVNTVPVVVKATNEKNGQFEFNNFGIISTKKNNVKKHTP